MPQQPDLKEGSRGLDGWRKEGIEGWMDGGSREKGAGWMEEGKLSVFMFNIMVLYSGQCLGLC